MYDVIIIGAGPAGLSAGIYAVRAGLNTLILDKASWGGQTVLTAEIENYPAVMTVTGPDFAERMYEQLTSLGGSISLEEVKHLELKQKIKIVETERNKYQAHNVILASGLKRRKLGCQGEETFAGRGVSYCAICDGRFFRGRDVAVVGGGNSAMEDALYLSAYCNKVTLLCRKGKLKGEETLRQSVEKKENIRILYDAKVVAIEGNDAVQSVTLNNEETLSVSGVFIAIGYEADSGFLQEQVDISPEGYVVAGEDCKTSVDNVYIAGDLRTKNVRQIVTAAADGAVAALTAADYVLKM